MKVSRREAVLGLATLAIVLFGSTAIVAKPRIEQWKSLRARQAVLREEILTDQRLIDERPKWQARFWEISRKLISVPADKETDAYWLSVIERMAAVHSLTISKRQALEEKSIGDVYEVPIEVQWEGSLSAVTHFLFDLQSQGAMFDVRQLLIKPTARDQLRGRFVLYCAYTREKAGGTPP